MPSSQPFEGHSLVGLDKGAVERAVLGIPEVRTVKIDRDFPNTLRVFVRRESTVAVIRQGGKAWLVAASGKVVRPFPLGKSTDFPRIWMPATTHGRAGAGGRGHGECGRRSGCSHRSERPVGACTSRASGPPTAT